MSTTIAPLVPELWADFEDLFGKQGACYGCWCTHFRLAPAVRMGELVTVGVRLGTLVVDGSHCAPSTCLHWGVRVGVDYVDPLGLLPGLLDQFSVGVDALKLVPFGTARITARVEL